jgi:hypothetical protein
MAVLGYVVVGIPSDMKSLPGTSVCLAPSLVPAFFFLPGFARAEQLPAVGDFESGDGQAGRGRVLCGSRFADVLAALCRAVADPCFSSVSGFSGSGQ